jgi:hypothetical protein
MDWLSDIALERACSTSVIGWSNRWGEWLLPSLHGEIAVPCSQRLSITPPPSVIWLASSGPEQALLRKLNPLQQQVEQLGYRCVDRSQGLSHGRILQCQLESKLNPVP